ncbi:alpha-L-rhamnosidase [Microbacterium indicum]|uniref:alpha-L-rhamnosidase n=1 Tax=Microbacterium indicum TaxID=358100 RepID=UPI00040C6B92|nr:alpha-L-rhamnosidase [Microbacterium indicum]
MTHPEITELRAGRRGAPAFQPTAAPDLSWRIAASDGWLQESAVLELRRADGSVERHEHADDESVAVAWPFAPLAAYDTVEVRVSVTGADGSESSPSSWTRVATGPLTPADWRADFIASADDLSGAPSADVTIKTADADAVRADLTADDADRRVTRFHRDVEIGPGLTRALLSYTAHGIVDVRIDGATVSDDLLAPGWTAYADRLLFRTVDVTDALPAGPHALGAEVGPGWYAEHFGFDGDFRRTWHGRRALSAQLRLEYADGRTEIVTTDPSWLATVEGPTTFASVYQGERCDARLASDGLPGAKPAEVEPADPARLAPAALPPVRVTETRDVAAVVTDPEGRTILDFGQNLVGRLRITVTGDAGTVVTLRHAEVLEDGSLGTRALRFAAATDTFTLAGGGSEEWAPRFTFHGFRYARIDGVDPSQVTAVAEVIHTDLPRTGHLTTNVPALDRLHENVVWGTRGNFVSLPTDCPQRDERLGWTGDIQVFAPTASFLFDVDAFLASWIQDFAVDQKRLGGVGPLYSPLIDQDLFPPTPMAAWSDAATVVPTVLWDRFRDRRALEAQYESMTTWVDVVERHAPDGHWDSGMQLADWLDPTAPPENPAQAQTDPHLVAQAYYARSARLVSEAADLLGRRGDATRYAALAEKATAAFRREYVRADGRMSSDAQTAYALAIVFELLPDALIQPAGDRLAEIVAERGHRIGTGFAGTPIVSDALTRTGHRLTAQRMLQTDELPSWLYPVSQGATTIWERWDSMLPDGSINPGEMTSFNHYALGAVADWMHRDVGGIAPLEPGYRRVLVRPRAGLTDRAAARFDSLYGEIRVEWRATDPSAGEASPLAATVSIPANVTAVVDLPGSDPVVVGSGVHTF